MASLRSAIYTGTVRHRRRAPARNDFTYRIGLLYLDLDELPELFRRRALWSASRPNLAWFRRSDYLGDPRIPLDVAVRDEVEQQTGRRPTGPIRVLTQLRTFGYLFNPVSFYYCFDPSGERVEFIVAEITNTPWQERHSYVLDARGQSDAERLEWTFAKSFHVSPFFDMDQTYRWRCSPPGEQLRISMQNLEGDEVVFSATLELERRPWSARNLLRLLWRYPAQPLRMHLAIYWQAARLWWKRTPFFTHPEKRVAISDAEPS